MAHSVGVSVEGELGCLGSLETRRTARPRTATAPRAAWQRDQLLTDPDQAVDFVADTKVDALAVAIGTSHGAYKFSASPRRHPAMDVIEAIHARLPDMHLVMHGSSSVPQELQEVFNAHGGEMPQTWGVPVEEIERGIRHGVRKVNIDTDCRIAMTGQFRKVASEKNARVRPAQFLKPAMEALSDALRAALRGVRHRRPGAKIKADAAGRDGAALQQPARSTRRSPTRAKAA